MIAFLVRHASAGLRGAWEGDDRLRPLDRRGRAQVEAIARFSGAAEANVRRILSSLFLPVPSECAVAVRGAGDPGRDHTPQWAEDGGAAALELVRGLATGGRGALRMQPWRRCVTAPAAVVRRGRRASGAARAVHAAPGARVQRLGERISCHQDLPRSFRAWNAFRGRLNASPTASNRLCPSASTYVSAMAVTSFAGV